MDDRAGQLVVVEGLDDGEGGRLLVVQGLVHAVVVHRLLTHRRWPGDDPSFLDDGQVDAQVVPVEAEGPGVLESGSAEYRHEVVEGIAPGTQGPAEEVGLVVSQHVLELRHQGRLGEGALGQRSGDEVPDQDPLTR